MDYSGIKSTKAFMSFLKTLYQPRKGKIESLTLPRMRFLRYDGQGAPSDPAFKSAIMCLYAMAYTLKMGMKFGKLPKPKGYFDYKIPPLEGLWWFDDKFKDANLAKAKWRLLIMQPAYVDAGAYKSALAMAKAKNPEFPWQVLAYEWFEEGRSVQMMHIGPYAEEPRTIAVMKAQMDNDGLADNGPHHEIYLSDPRRTAPEKLRTVLRFAVKKAGKKSA